MSTAAYDPDTTGLPQDKQDEALWRRRIEAAESDPARKDAELSWLSSLAFVAGKQWTVVDRRTRTLKDITETPNGEQYADVDLVVTDIIMERRGAALGELEQDSDRPEFLAPGDGDEDSEQESVQAQVNRALGHVWDFEADADQEISDAYQKTVDLGVAAIRVRYDKYAGPQVKSSKGEPVSAPIDINTGKPIVDAEKARGYVADAATRGETAKFTPVNEGKICLEAGSAFNLLVPPGIAHEKNFPWEIWVRPAPLDDVLDEYPSAKGMTADSDIGSILGTSMPQIAAAGKPGNLRDHVWLYTCYQRPTRKHPKGRVAVLAGGAKRLLQTRDELPYQTIDGCWHPGIVYLHWWRLTDKFWSRGLVETLKDPQRLINRTETQLQELIDRSMPFGITEEGALPEKPSGRPMQWVEMKTGTTVQPQWIEGPGPSQAMRERTDHLVETADRASTISALKLGENPTNVNTYSQLATLNEQEAGKRSTIRAGMQRAIARLSEFMLLDIQTYWPDSKQVLVAGGPSNELQAHEFSKSTIPPMYIVRPAVGPAKPRSQGAQLQLVADVWAGVVATGAFTSDPNAYVKWLKESNEAGEPLPLPVPPSDNQADLAERENHALMAGEQPAVAYWDVFPTHLPIHRAAEDQARLAGDIGALARIEHHVQEHREVAAENAAAITAQAPQPQMTPPGSPVPPGTVPSPIPPPEPGPSVSSSPPPAAPPAL